MMDANEESEIFESLGRVSRTAAAGTMQTAEMASRREQMSQSAQGNEAANQQRHAETMQRLAERDQKQEASIAQVIRNDAYQRHFWTHAGSEQIADYMTASAHLAPRHAEARSAYMHISDVLGNDYGINIEQMNRDHPTSLMDRHHALRDALDDYFARHRMDAEADQPRSHQAASIDGETERGPHTETGASEEPETTQDPVVVDQDQESHTSPTEEAQARAAAAQTRNEKNDSLADAQQYTGEARMDAANTRAEEATGGRQPHPYRRTSDADLAAVEASNPQAAAVRSRTRQNFPQPSKQRIFDTHGPSARIATTGRTTQARGMEATR